LGCKKDFFLARGDGEANFTSRGFFSVSGGSIVDRYGTELSSVMGV